MICKSHKPIFIHSVHNNISNIETTNVYHFCEKKNSMVILNFVAATRLKKVGAVAPKGGKSKWGE